MSNNTRTMCLAAMLVVCTACSDPVVQDGALDPSDAGETDTAMDIFEPDSPDTPIVEEDAVDPDPDADVPPPGETGVYEDGEHRVTASIEALGGDLRRYTMTTTAPLRDDEPADGRVVFSEEAGQMILRSGSDVFDALFALAIEETRQNSVSSISDFAFNEGRGVACECFETGAKWNYVWTRDTAYAVDLGLAMVDPVRARNALDFKLSAPKGGGGLQIVQDTGSGGSWPVSTDRVVWALGAWEALKFLDGDERRAFRDRAFEALSNTLEVDREAAFDPEDGLYRGEQSFLDWREQSYARWTAQDTVHIGASKALSTNVGHLIAMEVAAALAEEIGDGEAAERFRGWSEALSASIQAVFWLEGPGMVAAIKSGGLDPALLHKFELLGQSLAVLRGVLEPGEAARTVATYPHGEKGPPVLWPQQPQVPIYHNRGIWPFVTAYGLLAAREVGNDAVFDLDLASLVRGAALNLSNMENFEFLTQAPFVDDGEFSGPVVNSRRQLWSVAGYIGAIVKGVFGVEVEQGGLRVRPFVTPGLRHGLLASSDRLVLSGFEWRGKRLDIEIILPEQGGRDSGGAYTIKSALLGDQPLGEGLIEADRLQAQNRIVVELADEGPEGAQMVVAVDDGDFRKLFAPREPNLHSVHEVQGGLQLSFDSDGEEGVAFNIFRDGQEVASGISETTWRDEAASERGSRSFCYAVEAVFTSSGHRSHHSRPQCWWGGQGERVREISAYGFGRVSGGYWGQTSGRAHYVDWGDPGHVLEMTFRPHWTGLHRLQLVYGNGAGPVNTGITAAVKRVVIEDALDGSAIAESLVVMPHLGDWERWGESSLVDVRLEASRVVRVRIEDGVNMSYLAHFEPYTGGLGGGVSPFNRVNIAALKILSMDGAGAAPDTGSLVSLDGQGDFDDFPQAQRVEPGVKIQPWSAFAMTWDRDFLYIAAVSEAFEAPYKAFNLYIEAASGPLGSARSSAGIEYSGQTAALPFGATHLITARQLSEDGAPEGPWNGIMRREEGAWVRQARFEPNAQWWISPDQHVVSLRVPLASLGAPERLRLVAHIINGEPGGEWKDTIPSGHTPWADGGGYYEIDLSGTTGVESWLVR